MTSRQDDRGEIHYEMILGAFDSTINKHKLQLLPVTLIPFSCKFPQKPLQCNLLYRSIDRF